MAIDKGNIKDIELQFGIFKQDLRDKFKSGHEKGYNFHLALQSPSFYSHGYFGLHNKLFTSISCQGLTSYLGYAMVLRMEIPKDFFVEASLGGVVHNGRTRLNEKKRLKRRNLGSRFLFHESLSLGYNFNPSSHIAFIVEHASNAGLGQTNAGITNIGMRYGFKL